MRFPRHSSSTVIGAAFAVTMLGTTVPTPLYPAYEHRFSFGALTVTLVYAAYAVGVLSALLLLGRASDDVGRRPVLFGGLLCAAASSGVFLFTGGLTHAGLPWLFAGRVLSGLSAGIFTGTATATISDLAGPDHPRRASIVAAVANIGGLGLGPLISGQLAAHAAHPLRLVYVVHLVLLVAAALLVAATRETVRSDRPRRLHLRGLALPSENRAQFVQAGTAAFAGFALLGQFTAVTPAVLALLGHHDPALTGLVVFAVFAASTAGQLASVAIDLRPALLAGTAALVAGLVLVGSALAASSFALLVAGGMVGGFGQGLGFRPALVLVTSASPAARRAGVASSFFVVAYVGISLPVVGIGVGTRVWGLVHTGEAFAGLLAVLALVALVLLARRPQPSAESASG